jgi:hypothetical protein
MILLLGTRVSESLCFLRFDDDLRGLDKHDTTQISRQVVLKLVVLPG